MVTFKPKKVLYQSGLSNLNWDARYKAKFPGRRISKTGNIYYEYRRNRSDLNKKKPYV